MMTSKRIVMLIAGFVVLLFSYMGYARSYVGAIDGLPALPERFRKGDSGKDIVTVVHPATRDFKIKQAFGEECPELTRAFRLEVRTQGMVLSSGTPIVQEDGTVRLEPISIAMFGKQRANTPNVEINTIKGQSAVLTFERPVKSESDIGTSKCIKATLVGDPEHRPIVVVNNRSTPDRGDDLILTVKTGPLIFDDTEHTLTTDDDVHVVDLQSKPRPVEVWGTGMKVDLISDPPPKGPNAHVNKNKNDPIRGVKRVTLNSNVLMFLFADGQNNFMGGSNNPKEPKSKAHDKAAEDAVEKDQITIRTAGVFTYDLEKDHDYARFAAPAPDADVPEEKRQVFVDRTHVTPKGAALVYGLFGFVPTPQADHLRCQLLELRLHRKDTGKDGSAPDAPAQATGPRPDQGLDRGLDIEWARATGEPVPGRLVTIESDVESLEAAEGIRFVYETHPPAPSITTLTGHPTRPMYAKTRDGTVIHAQQVTVKNHQGAQTSDKAPGQQELTGVGPGVVDFIDKKDPKSMKIQHAWFRDQLISDKDDGKDRLTLNGKARFLDEGVIYKAWPPAADTTAGPTTLEGDTLIVWLESAEPPAPKSDQATPALAGPGPAGPSESEPTPGRRPHHVEAKGNVRAHSKDMNIHDTGHLVIRFKDVPPSQLPPPKSATPAAKPGDTTTPQVTVAVAPVDPSQPVRPGPAPTPAAPPPPEPPRPLDLSAHNVEVLMYRSAERSQMQETHCNGNVRVHQDRDPKNDVRSPDGTIIQKDKDVDILGDTLDTHYQCEGCQYILVKGDLAQLDLGKIYIVAPEVHIDQAANKSWCYCAGAMRIDSNTNFNGEALATPEQLTVHWGESMLVYGDYAEFHGNVLADQKSPKAKQEDDPTSRLACDALQLFFDRPISLRGDHHGEPQPKVRNLVCDRNVQVEQITLEEILSPDGKFLKYGKLLKKQYISGRGLTETALEPDTLVPARPAPVVTGPNAPKPPPTGNEINVSGPGLVRTWGPSGGDPTANADAPANDKKPKPAPAAPKKPPAEPETKLTIIEFGKRMYANNQSKTAKFWEAVRVLDLPTKDPDLKVDIDAYQTPGSMPPGSMFLNCAQLTVVDRGEPGKPKREMKAVGRALVQGPDFWGRAETVTYNEEKDQLIFDGGATGQATLARTGSRGAAPDGVLQGKRITYIKSTGDYKIDEGRWVTGR